MNSLPETPVLPADKKADSSELRVHHPYSPSTLQNREWCPCYEGRQDETPHLRTTAGTRAHGVVESGEDDHRLGDDDAAAAAECLDFVEQRRRVMEGVAREAWAEAADRAGQVDNQPPEADFQVQELKETYLPIDDLVFPDAKATTAGYVDNVLINYDKTLAEMFDWKFGFWPVEGAENNLQGISYALGLFKKFPSLVAIHFYFKQPHLGTVSDALFTRDDVPALYLRVQTVVARAREAKARGDFSMANPAVPVCNFCGNLGRCEKVCALACKVGRKFHPLEIPEDITPSKAHAPDQTALGLRLAAVLKIWCDAFRRQVTDRVLRGEAQLPPGQKIQEMENRQLVDPSKFRTAALRYLTTAEYESTLEPTFGAVETLIQDKAPRGQKKATVEEFNKLCLASEAVKMGDKFSFLRSVPVKE